VFACVGGRCDPIWQLGKRHPVVLRWISVQDGISTIALRLLNQPIKAQIALLQLFTTELKLIYTQSRKFPASRNFDSGIEHLRIEVVLLRKYLIITPTISNAP